ncbi:GNAT family N-acetyltransferase [Aquihabitans daechungensis]|uniref:GNAT family N-acetyltransferase n=1 Tax=Aquihabitans daechungensis TaxID=1052257 RepID=UPI003BA03C65
MTAANAATIRRATDADLDDLCRLRLAFIADLRGVDPAEFDPAFVAATREFFVATMADGRLVSWLAELDRTSAGVVSVLTADVPPLPERPLAHEGYIVNMYVDPRGRRRGIARALLDAAIAAAPSLGFRGFFLHATTEGRPLYASAGFVDDPRIMLLPVDGTVPRPAS